MKRMIGLGPATLQSRLNVDDMHISAAVLALAGPANIVDYANRLYANCYLLYASC
jgi:hypothetical protein